MNKKKWSEEEIHKAAQIFAKAEKLPTEQKHKYLQSLMRQVTWRFEDHTDKVVASSLMVVTWWLSLLYPLLRNGKPWDIDDDLKDHWLAQQITQSLMPDIIEASNIKKDIDAWYQSEFESKKSAIIAAMPAIKINDTPLESADWSDMTQAQKTYVMSLMRYVDRFWDPKTDASLADLTDEEKTAEINKRSSWLVQHVSKEMADTFHQKIDAWLWMSAKDLGVTWTLGESYTLMSDYLWVWWLNISDTTEQYVVMWTKMVAVIAAAIAVTVATWGALWAAASAWATASISAMASLWIWVASAAAWSAAWFAADMIVNGREFESTEQWLKDFFSTLLVDSATSWPFAMIPWFGVLASRLPRLAKIFTISEAALSKSSRLRTLYNGTEMLTSAAASWLAEERRQRYVMDQDVAADQMIQQVGMWLFLPMAMKVPWLMSKIKLSPERGLVVSKTQEARNELVAASQGTHWPEKAMLEAKIKEADAVLKELDADLYDTVDKIDAELQNIVNKTSSDKASLEEFMIKYLKYVDSIKKWNSNLVNKLRTTSFKNLTDQDLADFWALLQKRDAMEKWQQAPKEPEAPKQAPNKQQPHQNPRPEPEANKQANSTNSTEPKKEPEVWQQTNKTEAQKQKVSAQEQMEKLEWGERLEFPLWMWMAAYLITKKSQKNSNWDTIHSYVIEHRSVWWVIGRSTQWPVEPLSLNASEMKDFLSNLWDTPYKKMSQILEPKLRADDFSKKESSWKEVGVDVNTTYKQKVDEHYNEIEPFMNDADAIVSSLEKRSNLTAQEKQILYHNQQKLIVWKMSLQDPNMTPDEKIAFKKQQIDWLEKNESYYVQYKQSVQLVKEFNSIAANVDHLPQLHENIANMTKQQIEDLQRKLWFEGNDVDGILWRDTRNAIEEHIEKKQKDSQDAKKADEPIEIRAEDIQDAEAVEMQKLNDSISSILEMTTNKINDLKSLGEMNLSNKQISELYYLSQRQLVLDKLMGNTVMSVKEKLEYKNNALQWLSLQNNNQAQYKEAVWLLSSFAWPLHPKLKSLDKNMANMSQKQIEWIQAIIWDKQNWVISQESVNKIRDYLDNKSIKSKQDTPEFIESYVNWVLSKNHSMDAKNLPYTSLKASLEQWDWFLYPESWMMFNVVKKQTEWGWTVLVQTTKDVLGNIDEKYYSDDFHSIDQFMKAINKFWWIYLWKLNDVDSPNKKNTVWNGENLPNSNEINNNLKKIFDTSYISKKDFESALVDIWYDNLSTSQLEKLLLEIDDTIPRDLYKLQSESADSYNWKKLLAMRGEWLSDIEALCLRNYTWSEFRDYNWYLRAISSIFTKKTTKELLAIKIQTDILKRGMDKLAKVSSSDIKTLQKNNWYKESWLLFRGLSFNSNNELQTFLSWFKKNETWSDNWFLSTTINPNLNFAKVHPFKCTFVVRNENPWWVYINDFSMVCDEAEVLFPPWHKFKVFSEPKEVKPWERVIEIWA